MQQILRILSEHLLRIPNANNFFISAPAAAEPQTIPSLADC